MAFDQSTRNRLQKFVNDARNLLTEEFTRQLQATYGLDPKAGAVAAVDSLTHLDNRQRQTANVLRDTLAHYLATTHGKGEKDRTKQALSRIVREQAFTVLNRLAALRMAETRGFLLETIAKGYNAKGFQLYKQLAGSALGETGEAYRNYLYSVFDEFSLDLAVLFDRHSAQGRLFPRESALLELLDLINHHEIEPLWAEDETIGWIYQYFNSQEERKKMRAESQAPRNSRELAVRNQFFTPRYVVEFLTDNTLGRIWYEMTQGNTQLVDSCRYLVRRPTEVFLKSGKLAPEQAEVAGEVEALSQEELLKQPVYIPHRAIKDPRCIRMLDPACGSMHFGLYAFDLYERIYKEAWQLEAELGAEAFVREGDLKPLHQTYESFESYKIEVPRLIIEHNIHGVDIDPRAVQIAGLSLWQRAQRAWQQQDIKPQHRPVVRKSNIVCAEPMPGEKVLLQEFASSLNPPVLGQLLEAVFDKMELAGEAGTLLKIEEEIQSSIHEAKDQWQAQSGSNSVGDMFQAELDQATPQRKLGFDLSGVDDESFWDGAEQLILDALSNYADKAASNADQKRLFAEDAAKGFAFIDLCRKRFDVVLMNPPFGQATDKTFEYLRLAENINFVELYASFVSRALDLIAEGYVGAITSKGFFSMTRLAEWRQGCFTPNVHLIADLGLNVMDSAFVESAAYVLGNSYKQNEIFVKDVADEQVKDRYIRSDAWSYDAHHANGSLFVVHRDIFLQMPEGKVVYRAAEKLGSLFNIEDKFESYGGVVRTGLTTFDDNRFVRLLWEVPIGSIGEGLAWEPFSKGGEFAKYYAEVYLCVKRKQNGAELAAVNIIRNGQVAQSRQGATYYYRPGLTFTSRSSRGFSVRALPAGCVISHNAPTIYPVRQTTNEYLLGWANSRLVRMLAEVQASASYYTPGSIKDLPWIDPERSTVDAVAISSNKLFQYYREQYEQDECSIAFIGIDSKSIFDKAISDKKSIGNERQEKIIIEQMRISGLIDKLYGMDSSELSIEILGVDSDRDVPLISDTEKDWYSRFISYHFGIAIGRWACLKNQHPSHDEKKANGFGLFKPYSSLLVTNIIKSRDGNDGILVDDETHEKHLIKAIKKSVSASAMDPRYEWLEVLEKGLSVKSLGSYFVDMKAFFSWHLAQYSKSRRSAPIYWPIQTPSGSYTLWFYYHALNKQTLYSGVNDYIEPRLRTIEEDLYRLRSQASRSSQDEKKLAHLTDLAKELREFRDELLRIAKFWRPNLNDGVQITAAPLWKLFQHKAWQKKLKETWENLEKGDYDWAHLACSIWPERVLRKCHQDRSLAIAHDVEDTFWHEIEVPVMRGKKATGETKLEWQPKELTDDELDALIQAKIKEMRA